LIEGEIIDRASMGSWHCGTVDWLMECFMLRAREHTHIRAQVVEVSESSLRMDQMVKVPLFAHFGVPEAWIVDGPHETVHFYRAPSGGEYTEVSSTDQPGVVALAALPEVEVDLSDLFG